MVSPLLRVTFGKRRPTVGAAEGCDLLILILRPFDIVKNQNQKIAACGNSYRETRMHQVQAPLVRRRSEWPLPPCTACNRAISPK